MKIGFIGLGKLGLPCAEVIAKKGFDVNGYDVVKVDTDIVKQESSIENTVRDRDIVFIAVPTPHHFEISSGTFQKGRGYLLYL